MHLRRPGPQSAHGARGGEPALPAPRHRLRSSVVGRTCTPAPAAALAPKAPSPLLSGSALLGAAATDAATAAPPAGARLLAGLGQPPGVVHQQGIQRNAVRQDDVADVVPADGQVVHGDRWLALDGELDILHMAV